MDETKKFKPGDVVCLRSHAYPMTVRYDVDVNAAANTGLEVGVHCDWISKQGHPQRGVYAPVQLLEF